MRLITNNPRKLAGLKGFDIEIVGRLPLLIETNEYNVRYLETKAEKLGHLLMQTKLITLGIRWKGVKEAEWSNQLQEIASSHNLLIQEDSTDGYMQLFAAADTQDPTELNAASMGLTIAHLGFDHSDDTATDWHLQSDHPYHQTMVKFLKQLKNWEQIANFKFYVAIKGSNLPENFEETINLGLAWHTPWQSDRVYEWFNFSLGDDDLAILNK